MINLLLSLSVLGAIAGTTIGSAAAENSVRTSKVINNEWTFNYFPSETKDAGIYEDPAFDDSEWSAISLPHTWQTYETTHELHPYIRNAAASDNPYWWNGWGWYRKHLVIGERFRGKRVRFEFDGVQKYSEIYLNGILLDKHKGGFTSFYVDATDAVRFGEDNLLVVAVNNTLNDKYRIPPMNAGNWVVYGGITRDVRIVVTDQVNIPFQGSYKHEGGTFIITEKASKKSADISVKTHVWNQGDKDRRVTLRTTLLDAVGKEVTSGSRTLDIKAGELAETTQLFAGIHKPRLWCPDDPYLYTAKSEVLCDGKVLDEFFTEFGIRTAHWDYTAHRLVLNGKRIHLHGINRHEEYVWLGQAFPKWIALRDMEDMKYGLDINYMRTAHYPNDPSVYAFMDRHGICIDEELPNIKNQDFSDEVQEQNCREMIRRDRNHPSIVLWSMGNETNKACDSRFAYEEDKTRVITVRQPYNDSYNPEFCRHTDKEMPVESYLRCTIKGWYDKDDADFEPSDSQWAGTEYWQHKVSRDGKNRISEHNGTVWLYADHGADREYVDAPLKHVNPKGWVDSWRNPKYIYYLWQATFSRKPMVHIQPHFWREQYLGQTRTITVDSNCKTVELYVNGEKAGSARPDADNDFCVEFKDVEIRRGEIKAVGICQDGTVVEDKVIMSEAPSRLTITASHPNMVASRDNILEVKVDIVDSDGLHVIGACNTLFFSVSGPARLVGPDVYVSDKNKHEEYEGTMYIDAPVTNLVRSTGETGEVTVNVSAIGLAGASISIPVLPAEDDSVDGIAEPGLSNEGRHAVAINTEEANFIAAPEFIRTYAGEVSFPIEKRAAFRDLTDTFLREQNPGLDTECTEYPYLLDAFCNILSSTAAYTAERGYIVADDFNFLVRQFNTSRTITGHLDGLSLDPAYKAFLKEYFADMIVRKGNDRNHISVCKTLDRIPSDGIAVQAAGEEDLKKLLQDTYPQQCGSLSKDDLKKVLKFIVAINPDTSYKSIRDKKTKTRTDSFSVLRKTTLFLPEPSAALSLKTPEKGL